LADDNGHNFMTRAALESLPEWERNLWHSERKNLEEVYCMDAFHHQKEASVYLRMPNGITPFSPWNLRIFRVPEPGKGKDYFICGYYKHTLYVFEYYISRISETLKKKKFKEASKFAGILAHFIEDASTPPHSLGADLGIDLEIIKLLLPPPDKEKRLAPLHTLLEREYEMFSLENYSPHLMGITPEESSFNLLDRFTDMLENSIKQIIPMVNAYYTNDYKTLRRHATTSARFASQVLADALHTAFCFAFEKFDEKEMIMLNKVFLSARTPFQWTGWAPGPYIYPVIRNSNMSLDRDFKPVPLMLKVGDQMKRFDNGFGVGAPFEITYLLPEKVYRKFSSYIGLHPDLGKGGEVIFKVMLDDKNIFTSRVFKNGEAERIEIDLKTARKISLVTEPTEESKDKSVNQAVWGEPMLVK